MTDIEAKALALINAEIDYDPTANDAHEYKALCRAIEQHEAFKQEVSDTLQEYIECFSPPSWHRIDRFIIPKPKPDPLVEVLKELVLTTRMTSGDLRAALEVRGLEIREKGQ